MLEVSKRKTHDNTTDIIVRTNEGEFILAQDAYKDVSIGCLKNDGSVEAEFRITQDDYVIYKIFFKFLKDLNVADDLEKVSILSTRYEPYEASALTVEFDEATSDIVLTLILSNIKKWRNEYWVEAPEEFSNTFKILYNELLEYNKSSNQITIFEYFGIDDKQFTRTRSSN